MYANPFRLSKINYRWNKSSGLGIKANCEFECTLRLDKNKRNPEESTFYNTIEPIRYKTVEEKRYDLKDLVCQRQQKLFTLAHWFLSWLRYFIIFLIKSHKSIHHCQSLALPWFISFSSMSMISWLNFVGHARISLQDQPSYSSYSVRKHIINAYAITAWMSAK